MDAQHKVLWAGDLGGCRRQCSHHRRWRKRPTRGRCKPGQDRRVDLPTIGPRTVELAAAANLAGIGVHAGGVILLEREKVLAAADAAGLFIAGVSDGEP